MSTATRHSVSGTGRGFFNPSCVQPGFLLGAETRVNLEAETSEVSRRKEVILGPERLRGSRDSMCWTPGVWSCQSVTDGEPREDRRSSGCWPLFETSDMGWWHYVGFSRTRDRAPSAHGAVRPPPRSSLLPSPRVGPALPVSPSRLPALHCGPSGGSSVPNLCANRSHAVWRALLSHSPVPSCRARPRGRSLSGTAPASGDTRVSPVHGAGVQGSATITHMIASLGTLWLCRRIS